METENSKQTVLYPCHLECGAKIVDFAGWEMPVQYPSGIIQEHLTTRKSAGLFDVSHMGRFAISGPEALAFLRLVLTNDAAELPMGRAHYTLLADERGGAIDDAFLYYFEEGRYLLVVNASNKEKDWKHLQEQKKQFANVEIEDVSGALAMIALQGPASERILESVCGDGEFPEPQRNALGIVNIAGTQVKAARTGYTGEPVCFELFIPERKAAGIWRLLVQKGAMPVGLGARDTLRLEASLPLYGHEYGSDPEGEIIEILSCPTAKFGISFSDPERRFIGRTALEKQAKGTARRIMPIRLIGKGVARAGAKVYYKGNKAGVLTSGTMVPYWEAEGEGKDRKLTERIAQRSIGLALLESGIGPNGPIEIEIRGKRLDAFAVKRNLDNRSGPVTFAAV